MVERLPLSAPAIVRLRGAGVNGGHSHGAAEAMSLSPQSGAKASQREGHRNPATFLLLTG